MPAIRLMMADELRNERVLPTICGKNSHNNNEMDVSHVNSYPLQLPTCFNNGYAQSPVTISSCGRKHMEDYIKVVENEKAESHAFLAAFDGHGGKEAGKYARDNLWASICANT